MSRIGDALAAVARWQRQAPDTRQAWVAKVAARDNTTEEAAHALYDRIFRACRHFGQLRPETAAELIWSGAVKTGDPVAARVDILEASLAGEEG